ncbi:MAG: ParB/RepB/Spo0J family partition protein [Sphingomonadaceae bacterium]
MKKPQGLGRGLKALMDEMGEAQPVRAGALEIPVDLIDPNPRQPRVEFDPQALDELAQSIRERGILQPLLLRPKAGGRHEIVAGERRWRAAQLAGLHQVPAIIREFDEQTTFEAALIENVQRADLSPLEEAEAYNRLVADFGHTQETIAKLTGKSRSHVGNFLRLLDLPRNAQGALRSGQISVGIAKLALSAPDPQTFVAECAERQLSVRQAEALLEAQGKRRQAARARVKDPDVEALEARLSEALGLAVSIRERSGYGDLTIRYTDLDQLDALIAKLQA